MHCKLLNEYISCMLIDCVSGDAYSSCKILILATNIAVNGCDLAVTFALVHTSKILPMNNIYLLVSCIKLLGILIHYAIKKHLIDSWIVLLKMPKRIAIF